MPGPCCAVGVHGHCQEQTDGWPGGQTAGRVVVGPGRGMRAAAGVTSVLPRSGGAGDAEHPQLPLEHGRSSGPGRHGLRLQSSQQGEEVPGRVIRGWWMPQNHGAPVPQPSCPAARGCSARPRPAMSRSCQQCWGCLGLFSFFFPWLLPPAEFCGVRAAFRACWGSQCGCSLHRGGSCSGECPEVLKTPSVAICIHHANTCQGWNRDFQAHWPLKFIKQAVSAGLRAGRML